MNPVITLIQLMSIASHLELRLGQTSLYMIEGKKLFCLSGNVFSTKVGIGDSIFTSPTGDGTAILRGHRPNHAKALPFCRTKAVPSLLGVSGVLSEVGMNACSVRLFVRVDVLKTLFFML